MGRLLGRLPWHVTHAGRDLPQLGLVRRPPLAQDDDDRGAFRIEHERYHTDRARRAHDVPFELGARRVLERGRHESPDVTLVDIALTDPAEPALGHAADVVVSDAARPSRPMTTSRS